MGQGADVYICHKAFNENKLFMARHNKNTQTSELRSQAKWQKIENKGNQKTGNVV